MGAETAIQTILPDSVVLSRVGLQFSGPLTEATASQTAGVLAAFTRAVPWLWGDLLNRAAEDLGVTRGPESTAWSEAKALILAEYSQLAPSTLNTYRWVCRYLDLSNRLEKLSFAHHYEALIAHSDGKHNGSISPDAMDKVKAVLFLAAEHGWSVADMREHIRREKQSALGMGKPSLFTDKTLSFVGQAIRGFKALVDKEPVTQWSPEKRGLWKQHLRPIHEWYEQL
jgi:hypothetical protein